MEHGFEPVFFNDSKILILGSFPSVKSRAENFYYGNKLNRFWKILSAAFSEPLPETTKDKTAMLKRNKIALWDIVLNCEIKGSLDSDIKSPEIADVPWVMNSAPIKAVLCNGQTAFRLFAKYFPQYKKMTVCLPSTSPANTKFDSVLWLDVLRRSGGEEMNKFYDRG